MALSESTHHETPYQQETSIQISDAPTNYRADPVLPDTTVEEDKVIAKASPATSSATPDPNSNDQNGGNDPPPRQDGIFSGTSNSKPRQGIETCNGLTVQKTTSSAAQPPYHIYTMRQRKTLVWFCSVAALIVSCFHRMRKGGR